MRILLATHARGAVGGVESYVRGTVPELIRRGHQLAAIFEHGYESAGARPDPYAGCLEWRLDDLPLAGLAAAARAWNPDLIWTHGLQSAALEDALLEIAPAVLFSHNYDGTCATGLKLRQWPHPSPCGRVMGPGCAVVNFTRRCGTLRPARFAAGWQRQRQRLQSLPLYRRVMVGSRHLAEEYRRHGVPADRLRPVVYPLQGQRGPAPAPRATPPAEIVMLARLTAAKGGRELLLALPEAQRRLRRSLHLTLAGDGPERAPLAALAQRLGLDVVFPGWIEGEERRRRLAGADLLATPSIWPEPYGMVGMEAAGWGVPAVAFAVGGIPEWLEAGRNGELAPGNPPTPTGLAAALVRALESVEHWNALRLGAWEFTARLDLSQHVDRLESIFAEALAAPAARTAACGGTGA